MIVAADVTQPAHDRRPVEVMADQLQDNTGGSAGSSLPQQGFFSAHNVGYLTEAGIDSQVATRQTKHRQKSAPAPRGRIPQDATVKQRMERKLKTKRGRAAYAKRQQTGEPVFGQIKQARGLRRFLLRGLEAVRAE